MNKLSLKEEMQKLLYQEAKYKEKIKKLIENQPDKKTISRQLEPRDYTPAMKQVIKEKKEYEKRTKSATVKKYR